VLYFIQKCCDENESPHTLLNLNSPMKLPAPTLSRLLVLGRVICASEAGKEFARVPNGKFSQERLQQALNEIGLNATLAEFTLLVQSIYEVFALDVTGNLTAERASTPFKGLAVEREVELLREIVSRKVVQKIEDKKDPAVIREKVQTNKTYVAVGVTAEELAYVAITAMNDKATRFQSAVESLF